MVGEPKVLLADEPTGALDSKTSKEVMDLIQKINKAVPKIILRQILKKLRNTTLMMLRFILTAPKLLEKKI